VPAKQLKSLRRYRKRRNVLPEMCELAATKFSAKLSAVNP
jgi:hypothetical protein